MMPRSPMRAIGNLGRDFIDTVFIGPLGDCGGGCKIE
jgi:hypothetical protein